MNTTVITSAPQFKIYGEERRRYKKLLSSVRSATQNFWHMHNLDKDMASICGYSGNYLMSDEKAQERFDELMAEVEMYEKILAEPYVMQHHSQDKPD